MADFKFIANFNYLDILWTSEAIFNLIKCIGNNRNCFYMPTTILCYNCICIDYSIVQSGRHNQFKDKLTQFFDVYTTTNKVPMEFPN